MRAKTLWYLLPDQIEEHLTTIIDKAKEGNCIDTGTLEELRYKASWYNTPTLLQEIFENLQEVKYPVEMERKPSWFRLFKSVQELENISEGFDCDNIEIPDTVGTINFTEEKPTGNIDEESVTVNITVYYDNTSGTGVPTTESKLFTNPTLREDFKQEGLFLFNNGDIAIRIDSTGTVTEVIEDTSDKDAPTAPENLEEELEVSTDGLTYIVTVMWDESTDNRGVTSYNVYLNGSLEDNVNGTVAIIEDLDSTVENTIGVSALDEAENESTISEIVIEVLPDTIPPSQPTNLTSTEEVSADGLTYTATLNWNESTDARGEVTYNVYEGNTISKNVTTTQTTIEGLDATVSNTLGVTAVDESGNESDKIEVTIAVIPDTIPPTVPSGITSTIEVAADELTYDATINWTVSTDARSNVTYNVYLDGTLEDNVTATQIVIEGLDVTTSHTIEVSAEDEAGNESGRGIHTLAIVPDTTPPTVPTNITSTIDLATDELTYDATINWTASTDERSNVTYNVFIDDTLEGNVSTTQTVIEGIDATTSHTVEVSAVDESSNESARGTHSIAVVPDTIPPTVPTGITSTTDVAADGLSYSAEINWNTSTDTRGSVTYNVYLDDVLVDNVTGTQITLEGVDATVSHEVEVSAEDEAGNESARGTHTIAVIPDTVPPTVPTNLTYEETVDEEAGTFSVDLSWTASTDSRSAVTYNVSLNGGASESTETTTHTLEGLSTEEDNTIEVTAEDAAGNESGAAEVTIEAIVE